MGGGQGTKPECGENNITALCYTFSNSIMQIHISASGFLACLCAILWIYFDSVTVNRKTPLICCRRGGSWPATASGFRFVLMGLRVPVPRAGREG
jgi:hypothetical protein